MNPQRAGTRSFEVLRSLISICLRTESCSVLVLQPGFLTSCAQETLLTPWLPTLPVRALPGSVSLHSQQPAVPPPGHP